MKKLKRILRPLGIALAVIGVMVALGFVERTTDRTPITDLDVVVQGTEGNHFIDERTVRQEILDQGTDVVGSPTASVDITRIEERLAAIPSVAKAEVYHTMDGRLHARVEQRVPIVRVIEPDGGSYYIDPEQTEELYQWLDGIPGLEDHEISIHGHTDDIGGKEYNQVLSQFRSERAFQKLIEKGIPKEQILLKDFGELNPLYDNNTWEGRRKNRRVDIIVKPLVL